MKGLTAAQLGCACRIFLALAYPQGPGAVPPEKRRFGDLDPGQTLEELLQPPVCQPLGTPEGGQRGYALRLGSSSYPHLKLQVVTLDDGTCVFAVDTHDALHLDPNHPEASRWAQIQEANRRLKPTIEHAWEEAGLLTFNSLLRRELAQKAVGSP
jgi:hypothetical protein